MLAFHSYRVIFSNVYCRKLKGPGVPDTVLKCAPDTCDIRVVHKQRIVTKSGNTLWTVGKSEVFASMFIHSRVMEAFLISSLTVLVLSITMSQRPVPVVLRNIYTVQLMPLQNLQCETPSGQDLHQMVVQLVVNFHLGDIHQILVQLVRPIPWLLQRVKR